MKAALSEEVINNIVSLYEDTKSINKVAKTLGLSYVSVEKYLNIRGVELPKKRGGGRAQGSNTLLADNSEQTLALYAQGLKIFEVSKLVGISEMSVSKILKENNVEIIMSQARRTEKENAAINAAISATKNTQEYRDKVKATNLKTYGVEHPNQLHLAPGTIEVLSTRENLKQYIKDFRIKTVIQLQLSLGCSYSNVERKLKHFALWNSLDHFTSLPEIELKELISSWGIKVEKNQKVIYPLEIDLYCEDLGVGIEFNGDYWHSEDHKDQKYHQRKSAKAAEQGIFIYHIFEYEWENVEKRKRIISQLRNIFGVNSRKIFARKCSIREISGTESRDFLNVNHLQGADRSSIKLGLFHQDELVSLMTFCKPRFTDKYQWELSRFCSLSDVSVVGGASKLFKHFIRNNEVSSMISYSDNAKTKGDIYTTLGFKLSHSSDPNYVWTDLNGATLTRYQTQMKNEIAIMHERGMKRIFDCGSKVFVWSAQIAELQARLEIGSK